MLSTATYTDPCAAWKAAGPSRIPLCDTDAFWRSFGGEALKLLESDPENRAALRAARTLKRFDVRFAGADLELDGGQGTAAQYNIPARTIEIDFNVFRELMQSRFPDLPTDRDLRFLADSELPWIVHELAHARVHGEMSDRLWGNYSEDELVPYAEQASYLMRRLRREPDAFKMRCIDERLSERLGWPRDARRWWFSPLATADVGRVSAAVPHARESCGGIPADSNFWFLTRSMAGGFPLLEANLSLPERKGFGLEGPSLFAPGPDHRKEQRKVFADRRKELDACRPAARAKGLERWLDEDLGVLSAKSSFYFFGSPLSKLQKVQRKAIKDLEEDLLSLQKGD